VYRGSFNLPQTLNASKLTLAWRSLEQDESIYLNGKIVAQKIERNGPIREFALSSDLLRPGRNVIAVLTKPAPNAQGNRGDTPASKGDPGLIKVTTPPDGWKRSLFNGLAQIIVQSTGQSGEIVLTARANGVNDGVLNISANPAPLRAAIP
jgi:beta-galactosidase